MGEPDRAGLMNVELSSDGTRAAVERSVQNNVDIWLVDSARTARFTNDKCDRAFSTLVRRQHSNRLQLERRSSRKSLERD
jgi:hypothetical protein